MARRPKGKRTEEEAADEPVATGTEDDAEDSKNPSEALIAEAMKRWDLAVQAESPNYEASRGDIEFYAGEQWEKADRDARKGGEGRPARPTVTDNRMPQFVRQTTGDLRANKPAIKVSPAEGGDDAGATIREGVVQHIEYNSAAGSVYADWADQQCIGGLGHARVRIIKSKYAKNPDQRDVVIELVPDPLSVWWDPSAVKKDRSDARWCFVESYIPRDQFEEDHPDIAGDWPASGIGDEGDGDWVTRDEVRVVEYIRIDDVDMMRGQRSPTEDESLEARVERGEELDAVDFESLADDMPEGVMGDPEPYVTQVVRIWTLTSTAVIPPEDDDDFDPEEGTVFPGPCIPIVPAIGEELRIGRRVVRRGLIRDAKDMQRLHNWVLSLMVEGMAVAPRGKWKLTEKMIAGREADWASAHTSLVPYLAYTPDPAQPGGPEWVNPTPFQEGLVEAARLFDESMKGTTGIYDAKLGARSNETSGVAIERRDQQADTSTYIFVDNFLQALTRLGRILIDVIPYVYTEQRTLQIVGRDGREQLMEINAPDPVTGEERSVNPIDDGMYNLRVEAGPAFVSARREASAGIEAMITAFPQSAPFLMPILAELQDWPQHHKVAEVAKLIQQLLLPQPKEPTPKEQADVAKTTEEVRKLKMENDANAAGFNFAVRAGMQQFGPTPTDSGGSAAAPNGAGQSPGQQAA